MKLANRIFLFFGALSVISFVQFDAMAKCSETPDAGEYCGGTSVKDCIPGCYCIGGNKNAVGVTDANLKNFCTEKQSANTNQTDKMNQAGIYLCSKSAQFSKEKSVSSLDCKDVEWCNKQPDPGKYCERKYKTSGSGSVIKSCPDGCWCEGKDKGQKAVGILNPFSSNGTDTIPLAAWCGRTGSNRVHNLESYLNERGVHYCPDDFPHSDNASEGIADCYAKANETNGFGKMYYGEVKCEPGRFLRKGTGKSGVCIQCTSGSYCGGGIFVVSYKENQGIESCPRGYDRGGPGATRITDCKNASGQSYVAPSGGGNNNAFAEGDSVHCQPGQYLDTARAISKAICVQCEAGYSCPNGIDRERCFGLRQYSNAGQAACSTCLVGQLANSTHTGCEAMTINMGSTDVAAQRVDVSDLVAFDPTCLNGDPSHKVYFLRGAGNATGTMNPVNKCTGDTVTLPSSGFTRAGYQFDKWNCDNNNIGTKAAGATFTMPNADVNCTAQWTPVPVGTYTVSYTCGDGTGSAPVDNGSYAHNDSVTVKSNTCTAPSGKTFDKWSCNGTVVTPGNQFTITENTTCKAQWKNDTDQTVHCPQGGKYWNGNGCADCPMGAYCPVNDDERHECENNTYSNTTGNAVCTACPVGETAINNHTDCTSNQTVTCGEGKYLPAGSSNCVQCPDGYGCSGGTFEIKNFNQGREQCMPDRVSCQNYSACCYCPDGSNPNDTYSGCVNSNGTVVLPEDPDDSCTTAGKYWDGDGCIICESGYFCPGNGQHYKCPFGGASTQNKASCVLNLNETQMEYNKCWLRYWNNAAAYRKCLYGIDLATLPH